MNIRRNYILTLHLCQRKVDAIISCAAVHLKQMGGAPIGDLAAKRESDNGVSARLR
jgi:hypothetical protein